MSMPSGMELVLIVVVILLLFGGKKIPELAKGLAGGIKSFKQGLKDDEEVAKNDKIESNQPTQTTVESTTQNNQTKQA